jgi:hypothetical protein
MSRSVKKQPLRQRSALRDDLAGGAYGYWRAHRHLCGLEGSCRKNPGRQTGRGRCRQPGWWPKPGSRKIRAPRVNAKAAGLVRKRVPRPEASPAVLTIGHSVRTLHEFIRLLQAHGVTRVVDVRTVPRSRHNPQFNKTSLPTSLQKVGLGYVHLSGLGGLRRPVRDSVNLGWRNASFRGYADYMQTPEFEKSLREVMQLANRDRIALMCAEAVPWRCHRSLIADALLAHGIRTEHIMSPTRRQAHTLTTFARVDGTKVTYPGEIRKSNRNNLPKINIL